MVVEILNKNNFDRRMIESGIRDNTVDTLYKEFFISICNTHGENNQSWFHRNHRNVLRLFFDDIEHGDPISPNKFGMFMCKLFDNKQAEQILKFMHNFKWDSHVTVHCSAGISRSGAVGTFIAEEFEIDDEDFIKGNIWPNRHVLRTLQAAKQRHNLNFKFKE